MRIGESSIIAVRTDDHITSILDALEASRADRVEFLVPEGTALFADTLNMKLLKRESERLAKEIIIVTEGQRESAAARKVGLVVKTPERGEEFLTSWRQERHRAAVTHAPTRKLWPTRPSPRPQMTDIVASRAGSQTRQPPAEDLETPEAAPAGAPEEEAVVLGETYASQPHAGLKSRTATIVIAALLLALAAGAAFVPPRATLLIHPKREPIEFEMEIQARLNAADLSSAKNLIPAERLHVDVEEAREFPATAERELNERARGTLTIFNAFSAQPQRLVATTRFLDSQRNKIFRIAKDVTVPGAKIVEGNVNPGSITAEVMADQAGEESNIPSSRFSIPGFKGTPKEKSFYAVSESPMRGGFVGKTKVVSKSDVEQAGNTLTPIVRMRAERELRAKLPPDLHLVSGALSVRLTETSATPRESERAEKFVSKVKARGEALLIKEADVQALVDQQARAHLAQDRRLLAETRKFSYTLKEADHASGRLTLVALLTADAEATVPEEKIRSALAGTRLKEAENFFLREPSVERADLSLWPFWAQRLPQDPQKITVRIGGRTGRNP